MVAVIVVHLINYSSPALPPQQFQRQALSPEQTRELQDLGFDLTLQDMIAELKKYKEEHGDCDVPLDYGTNPSLGIWVDLQRRVS